MAMVAAPCLASRKAGCKMHSAVRHGCDSTGENKVPAVPYDQVLTANWQVCLLTAIICSGMAWVRDMVR